MLIYFRLTLVSVISISCLASAFSTLFVTEGEGEERKKRVTETRTQRTEESNVVDNQVIVEAIPFITDVFTTAEDVVNLTPLKIATVISAQHLLDTLKNIKVTGNLPQDNLNMITNIVDQFNKTTQIIKLTAEYVNISSHYILNTLNQFTKDSCDQDTIKNTMKTINGNFLNVISNNVKAAVREITEKTEHREISGSDVLVSSAYHIVAAFQEMTNQVMSLKLDNTKCDLPNFQITPPNSEQVDVMQKKNTNNTFETSKQDVIHQSIKKDHALPKAEPRFTVLTFPNQGNLQDTLTIENDGLNLDWTINKMLPSEPLTLNKKDKESLKREEIKIPESLKVAFIPERTKEIHKNDKENNKNQFQSQLVNEDTKNKITKKNLRNFEDFFTAENVNSNQELTMEIFSPQNFISSKRQESPSATNTDKNKKQRLESFKVYYYPSKTSAQHEKPISNADVNNNFKVSEDLQIQYYPENMKSQTNDKMDRENLKQLFTPFETLSLFGNVRNNKNLIQRKQEHIKTKSKGLQTNFKSFDDTLTIENLNRQDLTAEVFSPEAFMHNGKVESSVETKQEQLNPSDMKDNKFYTKLESNLNNLQKENPKKPHEYRHFYHKSPKLKTLDRELASSAVDSLSNVPSMSNESKIKKIKYKKSTKSKVKAQKKLSTLMMPWDKGTEHLQNTFFNKSQQKHNSCDERVKPVCGIDRNKSNFIIFLNDCQRKHHNSVYKTSYEWASMDTCVGFLLKYSSGSPKKYMNIIPQ